MGLFIFMLLMIIVLILGYLYFLGDGINWKRNWNKVRKFTGKYGQIIIFYVLLTTFLNRRGIIPYNSIGLMFTIWPLFVIYFGVKELIDKNKGDTATGVGILSLGLGFSYLIIFPQFENFVVNNPEGILASIFGALSYLPAFFIVFFFPILILGLFLSFIFRNS
ncbi:hypothetical protein [Natronospora cellulosivora (SeqCode)]